MKRSADGPSRLVLVLTVLAATLLAAPDAHTCPCSLWGPEAVPARTSAPSYSMLGGGLRSRIRPCRPIAQFGLPSSQ